MTDINAEIHAALDWLAEHGPAHGIAGPIVLSGWSAGGHLTAMCLAHRSVVAGLAISGIFELGPVRDTYLNDKLRLTETEIVALSPLRLPVVNKPLAITYGTAELPPLVSDSRDLHAKRAAAHAPGPLLPVPGAEPLHHRARVARCGWAADAAGAAVGMTAASSRQGCDATVRKVFSADIQRITQIHADILVVFRDSRSPFGMQLSVNYYLRESSYIPLQICAKSLSY